jgi:hypothetical protein
MNNSDILNSWKEISSYMGRGVRTMQRWEAYFDMPVHRPAGKSRSAVVAFKHELDAWLEAERTKVRLSSANESIPKANRAGGHHVCAERLRVLHSRADLLAQLTGTLQIKTEKLKALMISAVSLQGRFRARSGKAEEPFATPEEITTAKAGYTVTS